MAQGSTIAKRSFVILPSTEQGKYAELCRQRPAIAFWPRGRAHAQQFVSFARATGFDD